MELIKPILICVICIFTILWLGRNIWPSASPETVQPNFSLNEVLLSDSLNDPLPSDSLNDPHSNMPSLTNEGNIQLSDGSLAPINPDLEPVSPTTAPQPQSLATVE